jgi:hypothetical protein
MKFAKHLLALALIGAAFTAHAESDVNVSNAAGASAVAKLDFRITVPRLIFLRVGTGVNFADALGGANIDRVDFTLAAADIASGLAIAGASGAGAYPIVARVLGNGGNVTFSAAGSGTGLVHTPIAPAVAGPVVPWSQIVPAVAVGGTLPHPAIGGASSTLTATSGVVNATSNWTFSYTNTSPVAAGQYDGQVTYTAALP